MPRRNALFSNHFSWPGQLFLHTLEMPLYRLKPEILGDSTAFRVCVETAVLTKKNDLKTMRSDEAQM